MPNFVNDRNVQNGQDQKKHTQTSNATYYNSTSETPSALVTVFYDDSIRLDFCGILPENQRTERRMFNYEKPVRTVLYRHKANQIYDAYKEKIVPAIKEGRSEQVSIPLATVNQLMIDTNPDSNGVPRPRLKLIKNIDANTLIADPSNVIYYEFNTGEYILGYNESTGEFKDRVVTYNELELFMEDLHRMVEATSNAYVHTERVTNRYWKDTLDSKIVRIGEKNGLDLSYHPRNSYNNGSTQGSIFSSNGNTNPASSNPENAKSLSIDDISQIENDMMMA